MQASHTFSDQGYIWCVCVRGGGGLLPTSVHLVPENSRGPSSPGKATVLLSHNGSQINEACSKIIKNLGGGSAQAPCGSFIFISWVIKLSIRGYKLHGMEQKLQVT